MIPQKPLQRGEPASVQTTRPQGATELIYRRLFEATELPGKLFADMPRDGETILLVEDTSWLRELIRRSLQTCGYTVLPAAHGEEAIQLAGTHQGTVHLLVSDLVLPGIGGRRLAERIGALKPGIKLFIYRGTRLTPCFVMGCWSPKPLFSKNRSHWLPWSSKCGRCWINRALRSRTPRGKPLVSQKPPMG